jgi:hypothetical protein
VCSSTGRSRTRPIAGDRAALVLTLGGGSARLVNRFSTSSVNWWARRGSLVAGASDLSDLLHFSAELRGAPIVPVSLVRAPLGTTPILLADVRARGDLLAAVQGGQNVLSGGFARGINKTQTITPADQRREFSARDNELVVFVTWSPQGRLRGGMALKMYDEMNHVVVDSKRDKVDLRPGDQRLSSWRMPVPPRPACIARTSSWTAADLGAFVRITD